MAYRLPPLQAVQHQTADFEDQPCTYSSLWKETEFLRATRTVQGEDAFTWCREEVGFLSSESAKRLGKAPKSDPGSGPLPDALEDLLDALSAVYTVFPDLWVDPALR